MERKLLLMGLLRMQDMHGYQLNEVIDSHLGTSISLKKPTAYDLLKKMAADGWIAFQAEQEGNRPPRRVYQITPQGEAEFQKMLRKSLADYQPAPFHSDISLAFLDVLPVEEATALLKNRRTMIENLLQETTTLQKHPGSMQLVVDHQIHHLSGELEWLDKVIKRVESGEYAHESD